MYFDDKDLLKAMGLEVGDIIETEKSKYEIKLVNGIVTCINTLDCWEKKLIYFVNTEFEKIEKKIWTPELLEEKEYSGDALYYPYINTYTQDYEVGSISGAITNHKQQVINCIHFTKEEYAEEYIKELKKFNEEYKKNN